MIVRRRFAMVFGLGVAVLALLAPSASAAPNAPTPITERWQQLGGTNSYLGSPAGAETDGPVPGSRIQRFAGGTIYYAPPAARVLVGAIERRFSTLSAAEQTRLGAPVGDEQDGSRPGSRQSRFTGGAIYWSAETGAQVVFGEIDGRYAGDPAVREALGLPVGNETDGHLGARRTAFQNGQIYWTPELGAYAVQGVIAERYRQVGAGLGLPTSDEEDGRLPGSRVSSFSNGVILWSPATGAQAVQGAIAARYRAVGAEVSELGLPVGGEYAVPGGRASDFQYGRIGYDAASGATRIEMTGRPESSPLWTECRFTLDGVDVVWPANNRSLTVVSGTGATASLKLYLRTNSTCGFDQVVAADARESGLAAGSYPLAEAYPLGTNPYLAGADPRIAIALDQGARAAAVQADDGTARAGITIDGEQLRTVAREVRPYDTITITR
ncbi:hypothetical protein BI335_05045 [Enemella evansiae]|nr:hypothetical protein BI335_05045 [Enemella evansiae]